MPATLTELSKMVVSSSGHRAPVADGYIIAREQSDVGAFPPCSEGTEFVRFATDTAVFINGFAEGSKELVPAGSVEYFPARGRTFTTTAVA